MLEGIRGVGVVRGVLGAGEECRYSGARRSIGGIRGHWVAPTGVGVLGAIMGVSGGQGM